MSDSVAAASTVAPGAGSRPGVNKGIILFILGVSQLMIILDATIVNVALGHIREAFTVADEASLSWIVTGYALSFGGFLLFGGKLADRIGRKRVFMIGAFIFGIASLLGGFSESLGFLIAARGLQGLGGALMAPAALSILTVVFSEGAERNRAFGVWAAISAGGAAIGLILGGVLTQYLSWEWVFFVNVPIAVFAIIASWRFVPESRDENARGFDLPGTVLGTAGLIALVYGLTEGNSVGWGSTQTILTLIGALVLLVLFFIVQQRSRYPLVPLSLFRHRSLLGANLGGLLIASGMFSIFFFLVLWMQVINQWSPVQSGFGFLPVTVGITIGAGLASVFLAKLGTRPFVTVGPIIASLGLFGLGLWLEPDSSYVGLILPCILLLAVGMGLTFVALTSAAVSGIPQENAGIASALLNAAQQVGGAVGLAVLAAVSTGRTNSILNALPATPDGIPADPTPMIVSATVDGWGVGLLVGGALIFSAAIVMTIFVRGGKGQTASSAMMH